MESFVVRHADSEGDVFDWPQMVVLGDKADILAARMREYAESLALDGWKPEGNKIGTMRFDLEAWLDIQAASPGFSEIFVAISGALDAEDAALLERIVAKAGQDCLVVVGAGTELAPGWQSVIRLPPHRSWDAQWAWGIRALLDMLLEASVQRGMICIDPMDLLGCMKGRLCQMAVTHADSERRSVLAVEKALQSLASRVDLAAFDAFILAFHVGADLEAREIHQGMEALKDAVDLGDTTIMAMQIPNDANRFAVSLMAATRIV